MAERRMFSKSIINSDAFLDMPASARALYYHLSMMADDDGFINNTRSMMRAASSTEDDIKVLVEKKFILYFNEEGISVIKHWKMSNSVPKDRYTETKYKELKDSLKIDENGSYSLHDGNNQVTECQQNVDKQDTQDRLGKDRIDQDRSDQKIYTDPQGKEKEDERPKLVISFWKENSGIFNSFSSFKNPNDWKAYWKKSDLTKEQIEIGFKNYIQGIKSGALERKFIPSHVDTFVINGHIQKSQEPYKKQQTHDPPKAPTPVYNTAGKKSLGGLK
jgi:hypothetical protein